MADYETITFDAQGPAVWVTLSRDDVRNAFNGQMLADLLDAFAAAPEVPGGRVVVLTGVGSAFCAGADLNWMRAVRDFTYEQNLEESNQVAAVMRRIYDCPLPTIARVNGPAIGGGAGLVACCDLAVASEKARFSLSEVKLGLIPSCISPYVIRKIGEGNARELFLTGERISAEKAREIGLVNEVTKEGELDVVIAKWVNQLITSGPVAITKCKELIRNVPRMDLDEAGPYTAEMIAKMRTSDEGQEGMAAFLEKRKPGWAE
ncbi:MAG: enoyl-CoA hydratase/isomerase family protein [candidate division Zixibacteria bacterium]|nr:enoyl-CoA hydratase/isomerase family protein [candidate division Zixibacteria bacterium]